MAGDDAAQLVFKRLFEVAYAPLLAYALRRGSTYADAEDLVADTLLIAWRRRSELPGESELLPWLYGVARRVLANQRRTQLRRERLGRVLAPLVRPSRRLEQEAELADDVRAVLFALRSLPAADQELLRLAVWEGLSHREIGISLACSENAAALRLHRARLRLREALVKEARAGGHDLVEVAR